MPGSYVQAKQYKESARSYIVQSFGQIVDMIDKALAATRCTRSRRRLPSSSRLGGPYYLLPETVEAGDVRVHYVLVVILGGTDLTAAVARGKSSAANQCRRVHRRLSQPRHDGRRWGSGRSSDSSPA